MKEEKPKFKLKGIVEGQPDPNEKVLYYTGVRNDPHIGNTPNESVEEMLMRMRALYEGDELGMPVFLAGDYADGSSVKQIPTGFPLLDKKLREGGDKIINMSTPTGRISNDDFFKRALENVQRFKPFTVKKAEWLTDPIPGVNVDFAPYETRDYQRGYLAGLQADREGLSPSLNAGAKSSWLRDYFSKANQSVFVPMIVNPRRMNQRNAEDLLYDFEAPCVVRFPFAVWDSIRALGANRPHWSFTGDGKEAYDRMKAEYEEEFKISKLEGEERHESICAKMLRPVKKRRKAFRKLLDYVRSEVDGNRDAKSRTSDRNGKRGQRRGNAPRVPYK